MEKYRLWCKNNKGWEKGNIWIGLDGCLKTLVRGCPYPVREDTHILQRGTGKHDLSGREVYEGDIIESHLGGQIFAENMEIKYGTYEAYCPSDRCYMDSVGFYASMQGYPDMPVGPLEDYAKVVGNIFENPELVYN